MAIEASTIFKVINTLINQDDKDKIERLYDAYTAAMEKTYDLRDEITELKLQLSDMKQENKRLNEIIERKEKLVKKGNAYFYKEGDGSLSGPICPNCYTNQGFAHELVTSPRGAFCSVCETHYQGVQASVEGYKQSIR